MAFQNKALLYTTLFQSAAKILTLIGRDPKHLGVRLGMTMVLHTWGSALMHHPRVHCAVPGGGLSLYGERWISCRPGFFLPVRVLSRLFRRLYLEQLAAHYDHHDPSFMVSNLCSMSLNALNKWLGWRGNRNGWFMLSAPLLDPKRF
jgi:hypothetical protein